MISSAVRPLGRRFSRVVAQADGEWAFHAWRDVAGFSVNFMCLPRIVLLL